MPRKRNSRKKKKRQVKTNRIQVMPEYYKLVWAYVHEEFSSELLENSVTKPTAFRRDILLKLQLNLSLNVLYQNTLFFIGFIYIEELRHT